MTHPTPEQLGAYADGELSPAERRAAADHLEGCAPCRTELHLLEQLSRGFGRAAIEPSAGFEARSLERLRALPMPRRAGWLSWGALRVPALGLATLLLVAMGAWAVHEHRTGANPGHEASLATPAQPEEIAVASQADFLEQIDLLEDLDLVEALDEAKAG